MPQKTLFTLLVFLASGLAAYGLPADQDDQLEALGMYQPNFFAELQDVELQGHRAFVFGVGGLAVIELNNPESPALVGRYQPLLEGGNPLGGTRAIMVSFLPDQTGSVVGNLVLESNDPASPYLQIPLSGEGVDVSAINQPDTPSQLVRLTSWPNPFNPRVNIEFVLVSDGPVQLLVFDMRGMLLRNLLDEHLPAGSHRLLFDGRDDRGRRLATGEYFAVLKTVRGVLKQKMVLVR